MNWVRDKNIILLLVVITGSVFSPTFFNDFQTSWDDQWMLLNNPFVLDFSWKGMGYHMIFFYHGQYSPVNTLLYGLIFNLSGLNPGVYHGVCLLIHIINVLLVYLIIKSCVQKVKPNFNYHRLVVYAGIVALMFAIHPLQVESVAWISASKVILYGFFTLLGLWLYINYINSGRWMWFLGVILSYIFGFGAKEQAILFPLLLLAIDWLYGRFKILPLKLSSLSCKVVVEKIPFFMLALAMWYFSWQNNLGELSQETGYPLFQRILFGMHSVMQYIFRFIAPIKLYYFYFYPIHVGGVLPLEYWFAPILILMVTLFVWDNQGKKNRLVVFGVIFFVLNLLLVLHIIPMPRKMITADRYMYLSIIGLALVLVWLLDYLLIRKRRYFSWILTIAAFYMLALGTQSFLRTGEWKDSVSIKQNIQELIDKRLEKQEAIVNNPIEEISNGEE